jgi:hypothetical protein
MTIFKKSIKIMKMMKMNQVNLINPMMMRSEQKKENSKILANRELVHQKVVIMVLIRIIMIMMIPM